MKKIISITLVVLMAVGVFLATIDLGWLIIKDILTPPVFFLEIEELLDIFELFLRVLIGEELLETIKAYIKENVVHLEVVLTVAMIAIARKIIILDVKELPTMTLVGIAAIIIALAAAKYFFRRAKWPIAQVGSGNAYDRPLGNQR